MALYLLNCFEASCSRFGLKQKTAGKKVSRKDHNLSFPSFPWKLKFSFSRKLKITSFNGNNGTIKLFTQS